SPLVGEGQGGGCQRSGISHAAHPHPNPSPSRGRGKKAKGREKALPRRQAEAPMEGGEGAAVAEGFLPLPAGFGGVDTAPPLGEMDRQGGPAALAVSQLKDRIPGMVRRDQRYRERGADIGLGVRAAMRAEEDARRWRFGHASRRSRAARLPRPRAP